MTLIIGVRCRDGCLVIADKRNRVIINDKIAYEDNFEKIIQYKGYLIYNHGYNQIGNQDWKKRYRELTLDTNNPVYKKIFDEMKSKKDKKAYYVFINKNETYEISIDVEQGLIRRDVLSDRAVG